MAGFSFRVLISFQRVEMEGKDTLGLEKIGWLLSASSRRMVEDSEETALRGSGVGC